jgi:hypothetical protein
VGRGPNLDKACGGVEIGAIPNHLIGPVGERAERSVIGRS